MEKLLVKWATEIAHLVEATLDCLMASRTSKRMVINEGTGEDGSDN